MLQRQPSRTRVDTQEERELLAVPPRTLLHDACGPSMCCALVLACWVVLAGVIPASWGRTLDDAVRLEIVLDSENSRSYPGFVNDEEDLLEVNFYFFHIVNTDDIINKGEVPRVMELGPFTYQIKAQNLNATWSNDGDNIYFVHHEQYIFNPERSLANDSSPITSVSIPFQIILTFCKAIGGDGLADIAVKILVGQNPARIKDFLFTTKSVRDHLFGYFDGDDISRTPAFHALLALLSFLLHERIDYYPAFVQNFTTPEQTFRANGFDALHTGKVRKELMHSILWYHNYSSLKAWDSREANLVGGSDGHFFGRENVKSRKPLQVWIPELSSKGFIVPSGNKEIIDGIKTDRYIIARTTFQNATTFPPNAAYYQFGKDGLFNISSLASGLPLSVSKPHFLHGDPSLWSPSTISGLTEPDPDRHETVYHIHHCTGIGFQVSQRFQYNVRLEPLLKFAPQMLKTPVVIPIFWMETVDKVSTKHNHKFHRADEIDNFIDWIAAGGKYGGIFCLVCTIVLSIMSQQDLMVREERIALLNEDELVGDTENQTTERPKINFFGGSGLLTRAWMSFTATTILINITVGYVTWGTNDGSIEVWKSDPELHTSTTIQLILTVSLVGFFACVTGTLEARREIIWYSKQKKHLMHSTLLQGAQLHPLSLGWRCSLLCLLFYGVPLLLLQYLAICDSFQEECSVKMGHFILAKAALAGLEAWTVFFLSARSILKSAAPIM